MWEVWALWVLPPILSSILCQGNDRHVFHTSSCSYGIVLLNLKEFGFNWCWPSCYRFHTIGHWLPLICKRISAVKWFHYKYFNFHCWHKISFLVGFNVCYFLNSLISGYLVIKSGQFEYFVTIEQEHLQYVEMWETLLIYQ